MRHKATQALGYGVQGQAALETKVALQPASLSSRLHTRLTAAVDKRHTKKHKVSQHSTLKHSHSALYKSLHQAAMVAFALQVQMTLVIALRTHGFE